MIKHADLKLRTVTILGLVIFCIFYVLPLEKNINLGLDLKGGMHVLLRADTSAISAEKIPDAIGAAVEKIRTRIDAYGVKETSIQVQGNNSILVQVPGVIDRGIIDRLKEVGKLEFKLVEKDTEKISQAKAGQVPQGYELKKYEDTQLLLHEKPVMIGSDLSESYLGFNSYGGSEPILSFTPNGSRKFAKTTEDNVGEILAIVLDGIVKSAPRIDEPILSGEARIRGDFSLDDARLIVTVLNSGALPIPLVVEEERSVGPLLGSDSIDRGIKSIIFGAALVVGFVLIYYLLGGAITVICLILDLLFILAGLQLFKGTLTLPGIAGMILT
ncbi:MAG: hypothetical protein HQ570_03535, partial [Candidatus Omnitrophica bacterium]|nr:hypothetical protein [Candidatus Omnitrophota bacterium]